MADLRATQFAAGAITGTAVTNVYTVPVGKRIILKSIQLQEASGIATDVQIRLSGLGTIRLMKLTAYNSAGSTLENTVWIVFNAGQTIQLARVSAGTIGYVLSGSLLFV